MSNHSFEFSVIQFVNYASREGDSKSRSVYAACKGIQGVVIYYVDFWHRHTTSNAQVFNQVINALILLPCKRNGACSLFNHGGV